MSRRGIAILGVACGIATAVLGTELLRELRGPLTSDAGIFLAVGRGMLNGLTPYVDLFETKPLGMFLLSALTLIISPDARVAYVFHILAIVGIVIGITGTTRSIAADAPKTQRTIIIMTGFLAGVSVALYSAMNSSIFMAEPFGIVFSCLYVCVLASRLPLLWKTPLAAAGIMAAVLVKEPFAFALLASALILIPLRPRTIIYAGIYPFMIAFIGVVGLYLSFGILDVYIQTYLPFMRTIRLEDNQHWTQAFGLIRMLLHPFFFSPALFTAVVGAISGTLWFTVRQYTGHMRLVHIGKLLLAICLLSFAALTGPPGRTYPLFAVPGYLAFFFAMLTALRERSWHLNKHESALATIVAAALALVPLSPAVLARAVSEPESSAAWNDQRTSAAIIDRIMDRCGYDQYLYFGSATGYLYGLTRHSPLGPEFFMEMYMLRYQPFVDAYVANIEKADLIVHVKLDYQMPTEAALFRVLDTYEDAFTLTPPPCANGETVNDEHYTLLFRKHDSADTTHEILPLAAYLPQLKRFGAISMPEVNAVKAAVRRELGLADDREILLTAASSNDVMVVIVEDATTHKRLGEIPLNMSPGA